MPSSEHEGPGGSSQRELEHAKLAGVRLAARTLEHHLTNHLTLTIGYAELLAEDPELPPRLQEMVREVLDNAQACVEIVRRLRQVEELRLTREVLSDAPLLELP
jgi:nitrogen-specific signal transduction histidine kinase